MPAASINLAHPTGVWRPVYAHRSALHATADRLVGGAWQADLADMDLGSTVQAWQQQDSPSQSQAERLQAASAAVVAFLAQRAWTRTLTAIALAAQRALQAGWQAGRAIGSRDPADDTPYRSDITPTLGQAELSDQLAAHTAARVVATALTATARRLARLLVAGAALRVLKDALMAGFDVLLATDTALSAAYGVGLLAAYQSVGIQSLQWITAGDGDVCQACQLAEANSPYSPFAAPGLPQHPNCRCILAPA